MDDQAEQKLLERYLGREAAQAVTTGRSHPETIGEIKPYFVLFADVRHFSLLAEQISLHELRHFLGDFFQLFVTAIEGQGGQVNKFVGDGALALFAVSSTHGAMAPVRAALHLQVQFQQLCDTWPAIVVPGSKTGPVAQVGLGVGISHGEIFLGTIGRRPRFDFTAIGSTVNVAQRLASSCGQRGVYCTDSVQRQLDHNTVQVREAGTFRPRGMDTLLRFFQLQTLG